MKHRPHTIKNSFNSLNKLSENFHQRDITAKDLRYTYEDQMRHKI